jgi:hypothetical protein
LLRRKAVVTLLALAVTLAAPTPGAGARSRSDHPRTLHVAGSALAPGDGSPARPFRTISRAVRAAQAGDTVLVAAGRYAEYVTSARPGRPSAPIRIVGRPGAHLVGPRGIARGRLVQLLHDHVTVESLELSDANILVWVQGASGVRLLGNRIHDAAASACGSRTTPKGTWSPATGSRAVAASASTWPGAPRTARASTSARPRSRPEAGPTARTATGCSATGSPPAPSASR